jgi:serpin B
MTYAGAAGTTAEEMAATLHFTLQGDALHQAFNSLDTALESRSWQEKTASGEKQGVLVKTANSLWAQKGLAFEEPFLDVLAADYGAGVRLCDFGSAAEEARKAINDWVAGQTEDKIPELLAPGVIDTMTRLVLVNAIYLNADWASRFDANSTGDHDFNALDGQTVTVRMMYQESSFPYAAGDGWQAVELPYLRDELAMTLIVPDEGRFGETEDKLADGLIDEVVDTLSVGTDMNLSMPKFEFRTKAGLNRALTALGMAGAFGGGADFSGMTKQADLSISDVIHEAYVKVDEKGTEAAAATAVVMEEMAAMPTGQVTLIIDRPFIFALRDRTTGAILFMGRVTDPTA